MGEFFYTAVQLRDDIINGDFVDNIEHGSEMDHYMRQATLNNKQVIDMVTRTNAKMLDVDDVPPL